MNVFVFKKGFKHYLVPAESENNAWECLQKKLSWNMDLVKKQCKLIIILNENSDVFSI
jgi:hypothetical protein